MSPKPPRRQRYRGTHPRKFSEKYKEHASQDYPETLQKVLESGKTPAGTHRPIMVDQILEVLAPQPGEIAVDATLGYGGHASELIKRILPGGKVIGIDTDPLELPRTEARLRASGVPEEAFVICQTNFAALPKLLLAQGLGGVDMVLADLGCSSMQLDNPERGFSFKLEGPLDLRMNPKKGRPGSALMETLDEGQLAKILSENADEPQAEFLAAALTRSRPTHPIRTTGDLRDSVLDALALSRPMLDEERDLCVRRVFQALRIAVNEELSALESFLRILPNCLKANGRVAILTFHSGEDRRVKRAFEAGLREGSYSSVASEVIRPSAEEVRSNPRASAAKLRWAKKG